MFHCFILLMPPLLLFQAQTLTVPCKPARYCSETIFHKRRSQITTECHSLSFWLMDGPQWEWSRRHSFWETQRQPCRRSSASLLSGWATTLTINSWIAWRWRTVAQWGEFQKMLMLTPCWKGENGGVTVLCSSFAKHFNVIMRLSQHEFI